MTLNFPWQLTQITDIHSLNVIPQRAAHKMSVLKRFLYFWISGVSEPGRPKADDDGGAFAPEPLIGDAEIDLESCISWSRFAPKPIGINGWLLPCGCTAVTIHTTVFQLLTLTLNSINILLTRKLKQSFFFWRWCALHKMYITSWQFKTYQK